MTPLVLREDHGGLATLTLNRPDKLNALTVAMFQQLQDHVLQTASDTERVGLVVLRGAGKCFSVGHDLADISHGERPPKPSFQADTVELLAELPQPVIAAVHGHCYTHARWALTPVWGMSAPGCSQALIPERTARRVVQ